MNTRVSPSMSLSNNPPSIRAEPLSHTLASNLERAAAALARLDSAVAGHPLAPAWAYRARLDAVRRQAAVDGRAIDPWHLAAVIEGVRLRLDPAAAPVDRGAIFEAARYALNLYRWYSAPDEVRRSAIGDAAGHLARPLMAIRHCWVRPLRSMPGSIAAASGRRCAPPWPSTGFAAGSPPCPARC